MRPGQRRKLEGLTVVVPTLDAASELGPTLKAIDGCRVVVVDGGSQDDGPSRARSAGAEVIDAPRGRGAQLAKGARFVSDGWLLFLHADTRPCAGWTEQVEAFISQRDNRSRAAVFGLSFDDGSSGARRIAFLAMLRTRAFGWPYGDQGLLIHKSLYEKVGGYRDMPLMEDIDLVRRLGRERITILNARVTTSAARYRRDGYWKRPARNLFCLFLFLVGVPPARIARIYER